MSVVSSDAFRCPICKGGLTPAATGLCCAPCGRDFEATNGILDFFVSEGTHDFDGDPNTIWLTPEIVEARDTYYSLCARELRGVAFGMQEIARRTGAGCRVLEVGMGTGHFTRWLAEIVEPGTEIYAFDFSWPIIEKAQANTRGLPGITLFRANARGALPFEMESFDVVFVRLAPLGPRGVPSAQAGFELLKPGGWFFQAGWKPERHETPPTEWAIQHGYESAEHHVWQYWRVQTRPEHAAMQLERERLAAFGDRFAEKARERPLEDGRVARMIEENLLIAQKPA